MCFIPLCCEIKYLVAIFETEILNDFWTCALFLTYQIIILKWQETEKQTPPTPLFFQYRRQRFSLRVLYKHHGQRHGAEQEHWNIFTTLYWLDFKNILMVRHTDKNDGDNNES